MQMTDTIPDHFVRVKDTYQVHIWCLPECQKGLLISAANGHGESISLLLAMTLRMMDGQTPIKQLISNYAKQHCLTLRQSSAIVSAIIDQFGQENVIETRKEMYSARLFPPPITTPFHLTILQVQLTNKCNLHCAHCYAESSSGQNQMLPAEVIYRLIDEFAILGGIKLFLTGGEPLLHPNLEDIIVHAKMRHLFVYLSTNGFAITKKKAERLVALGVGAVNISIDGSNSATHDKFRGKEGSYDRALDAIDAFLSQGIPCATQTTLHSYNLDQSVEIVNMLRPRGVRSCFFVRMMPMGRGKIHDQLIPSLEQYEESRLEEYKNRRLYYGDQVYPEKSHQEFSRVRCSAGISQMYVKSDGTCYPCPSLESTQFALGKYPDLSLREIWVNRQVPIEELRSFDFSSMEKCKNCEHQSICRGGCAGNALTVVGNWKAPDPHFCITMAIRKHVQSMIPSLVSND